MARRRLIGLHQNVLARAHQLDHGQREIGKVVGVLLLLREQEVVEGLGVGLGGQRCAQSRGQLDDAVPALGRAHDAADGGHAGVLEGARDDAVGRHHELLNQRRGAVLLQARDLDGLIGQHHRARFDGLQIERAVLEAAARPCAARLLSCSLSCAARSALAATLAGAGAMCLQATRRRSLYASCARLRTSAR